MGQEDFSTRLHARFTLLRRVAATFILGSGLWLGAAAVSPLSAMASLYGISSNVAGTVHDDTDVTLNLQKASHGVTNAWCKFPSSSLRPKSLGDFNAGDNVFETEVRATYEAPNHDVISLFVASRFFSRVEASCSVSGNPVAEYRCDSRVSYNSDGGGNNAVAEFFVTRK
ncbi:MAG: hypothetical protein WAL22_10050 [Solirubrobacteraceae bacterium]